MRYGEEVTSNPNYQRALPFRDKIHDGGKSMNVIEIMEFIHDWEEAVNTIKGA